MEIEKHKFKVYNPPGSHRQSVYIFFRCEKCRLMAVVKRKNLGTVTLDEWVNDHFNNCTFTQQKNREAMARVEILNREVS